MEEKWTHIRAKTELKWRKNKTEFALVNFTGFYLLQNLQLEGHFEVEEVVKIFECKRNDKVIKEMFVCR